MRFLNLDFIAQPRRPLAAWAVLLAGALVFAQAADRYGERTERAEEFERQISRMKRQAGAAQSLRGRTELAAKERGRERERELLAQVGGDHWSAPLQAVEMAVDKDVALVALEQQSSARRIRISLEARSIDDALAFADRLRKTGNFEEVVLTAHETKKSTGMEVLGLTFILTWRPTA